MGLDTVELVMAFEEEFGIHIDDDDAANCATPDDVADYVYSRVRQTEADPCLSQKGFYKLRKLIVKEFNRNRNEIKPNSNLQDFLGNDIRGNWARLKNSIGVKDFPLLQRTKLFIVGVVFIVPAAIVSPLIYKQVPLELVLIFYSILAILSNAVTLKRGKTIPNKFKTVGSLVPYVECSKSTVWDKEMLLKRIIEITSLQLGIPVEKINKNSHFVHELGAD